MKLFLSILFIYALPGLAFTQSSKLTIHEREKLKLFCGKWILSTLSQDGVQKTVPLNEATYLIYNEDGSFIDSSNRFKVSHGTWNYDSTTHFLHTKEPGGNTKVNVVSLSIDELIVKLEVPGVIFIAAYKKIK